MSISNGPPDSRGWRGRPKVTSGTFAAIAPTPA